MSQQVHYSVMGLHFISDVHAFNYRRLAARWKQAENGDFQYMVACYVVAHPEIYSKIDWQRVRTYPFSWRAEEAHVGTVDEFADERQCVALSSGYRSLVDMAEHIYSGGAYPFNLDDGLSRWDSQLYSMFLECVSIRMNRGKVLMI